MNGSTEDGIFQPKQKLCLIFSAISFCIFIALHILSDHELINYSARVFSFQGAEHAHTSKLKAESKTNDNYIVDEEGCRIPAMFIYGRLVDPYLSRPKKIDCSMRKLRKKSKKTEWQPALFHDDLNTLRIDERALQFYGEKQLQCMYEEFFRNNHSKKTDTYNRINLIYYSKKQPLDISQPVHYFNNSEFIRVQCFRIKKNKSTLIHTDYFAFVPEKKEVEDRCDLIGKNDPPPGLSVLVIGLDALSRLNFYRQMFFSSLYLEQSMDAIEMKGFNKVGDNTFPNFVPMFGGKSIKEIKSSCWKSSNDFFDECPFIWKTFQKNGYRTLFAEDCSHMDVFNYIKQGFWKQPTDYYFRTFDKEVENEIGHRKEDNCVLCVGARLNLDVLLDYAAKLGDRFLNKRYFGLFWSNSFTHDYWNIASNGDEAVLKFLRRMNRCDKLNNTALIVVSDHGIRWGTFRETYQGRLEERLPMLWFVLPKWFKQKYKKAVATLQNNSKKLTTPFDLFETLQDFANLSRIEEVELERRVLNEPFQRQISLFLPVPPNRTCIHAQIPQQFCTCFNDIEELDSNNEGAVRASNAVVRHINDIIKEHPECAKLSLKSIDHARVQLNRANSNNSTMQNLATNYVVTIKTTPGYGVYEAEVRYDIIQNTYFVIGTVSRVNQYNNQSLCVDDYILKLYCFCVV